MPYRDIVIFNVFLRCYFSFFVIRITVRLLSHFFLVVDPDDAFQKTNSPIVLSHAYKIDTA